MLVHKLRPRLELEETNWKEPTSVEKQVFCALYALGQPPSSYEMVGRDFGLAPTTVCRILLRFCNAIWAHFGCHGAPESVFASWDEASLKPVMAEFESYRGLPNCVGAIDCTHIEHVQPIGVEDPDGYYNRHGSYSTILQAICDNQTRFMDVYVGVAGSTNDARVFKRSEWFAAAATGKILKKPIREVSGRSIQPYIVGDAAYPLSPFCMKPYPGHNLTAKEREFNKRHSSTRMCVERAFGILKMRWQLLNGKLPFRLPRKSQAVISACVVLHNLCIAEGDGWGREPRVVVEEDEVLSDVSSEAGVANGKVARDAIADLVADLPISYG